MASNEGRKPLLFDRTYEELKKKPYNVLKRTCQQARDLMTEYMNNVVCHSKMPMGIPNNYIAEVVDTRNTDKIKIYVTGSMKKEYATYNWMERIRSWGVKTMFLDYWRGSGKYEDEQTMLNEMANDRGLQYYYMSPKGGEPSLLDLCGVFYSDITMIGRLGTSTSIELGLYLASRMLRGNEYAFSPVLFSPNEKQCEFLNYLSEAFENFEWAELNKQTEYVVIQQMKKSMGTGKFYKVQRGNMVEYQQLRKVVVICRREDFKRVEEIYKEGEEELQLMYFTEALEKYVDLVLMDKRETKMVISIPPKKEDDFEYLLANFLVGYLSSVLTLEFYIEVNPMELDYDKMYYLPNTTVYERTDKEHRFLYVVMKETMEDWLGKENIVQTYIDSVHAKFQEIERVQFGPYAVQKYGATAYGAKKMKMESTFERTERRMKELERKEKHLVELEQTIRELEKSKQQWVMNEEVISELKKKASELEDKPIVEVMSQMWDFAQKLVEEKLGSPMEDLIRKFAANPEEKDKYVISVPVDKNGDRIPGEPEELVKLEKLVPVQKEEKKAEESDDTVSVDDEDPKYISGRTSYPIDYKFPISRSDDDSRSTTSVKDKKEEVMDSDVTNPDELIKEHEEFVKEQDELEKWEPEIPLVEKEVVEEKIEKKCKVEEKCKPPSIEDPDSEEKIPPLPKKKSNPTMFWAN